MSKLGERLVHVPPKMKKNIIQRKDSDHRLPALRVGCLRHLTALVFAVGPLFIASCPQINKQVRVPNEQSVSRHCLWVHCVKPASTNFQHDDSGLVWGISWRGLFSSFARVSLMAQYTDGFVFAMCMVSPDTVVMYIRLNKSSKRFNKPADRCRR